MVGAVLDKSMDSVQTPITTWTSEPLVVTASAIKALPYEWSYRPIKSDQSLVNRRQNPTDSAETVSVVPGSHLFIF